MRMRFVWSLLVALSCGFSIGGCSVYSDKLMAGSDIEVVSRFADEVKILKNRAIDNNSEAKFNAAKTIIENVDLTKVYDIDQVERIFGRSTTAGRGLYDGEYIVYMYSYGDKVIEIDFWVRGRIVVKSKVQVN